MRVAVVGGGIFGQVITWRLASGGADVVQIEEVGPGHAGSQSGDRSRVVRALYGDGRFVEAGFRSLELWRSWSEQLREPLIEPCGVLYIERDSNTPEDQAFAEYVDSGLAHLMARGARLDIFGPKTLGEAYEGISTRGVRRAVLERGAGFGRAAAATQAIAKAAAETKKAELITGQVSRIDVQGGRATGVTFTTHGSERSVSADMVVIAAGLGGARLLETTLDRKLPVRPLPHFVSYWEVPHSQNLRLGKLPVWCELGAGLYGFPDESGAGFKAAWHEPLRTSDGHSEPTQEQTDALRARLVDRFPALERATLKSTFQCTYDATPDENFLIGRVPQLDRLFFVGGMSGHGFKHAPAIGSAVASTILDTKPMLDLSSYALRFA